MADFPSIIDLSSLGADGDRVDGGAAGDYAGWSVACAGDVDGDGIDDILIGAPADGSGAGKAWLVFGKAGGTGPVDLGALTAAQGFVITGAALGDVAGWSVASAGDLNHDGLADIVIGARLADAGGAEDSGAAYVIFGRSGFAGPVDLAALGPGEGFAIATGAAFDHAGWSVAPAGDVNGDGVDDLLIGVPGADGAGADRGAAYVIFGHGGSFGDVDLPALGSQGFAITGAADYDEAGHSVASAGDVNGDGFDDLIVGAGHANNYAGAAYVVFGHGGGFATIDLGALAPGDGFALIGADGEQAGFSVASAGDINGDGFDDLIVGAPYADAGAGRAYLVLGHGGPFETLNINSLTASQGFVIAGAGVGDKAGWSVASAGDVNGDGFDDLIVGAPYADNGGGVDRGAAYVILGHNGIFGPIDLGALVPGQAFTIRGGADYDQAGRSVAFSGDFNNDGVDDLIVGAPYSNTGDSGSIYIVYGKSNMPNAVITGDATGDVTEAGGVANGTPGTMTDTGDLNDTDVDNAADSWQAVSAGGATDSGYGTYELSAAGVWVYTLDDNNAAVQALNGAATLTDTFTALTEDGTAQVVTVTINAQNDAASITGDATGDVTEAGGVANGTPGTMTDTGDLNDTDVDNAADSWQAVSAGGATDSGYGTYELSAAGVWVYTLDDNNAAVQALNGAATLTDTFTALTEDGTAQVVTVTINAQNDAASITGDATGDVTEAGGVANGTPGTMTDTGDLNDTDVDNAADSWQAVSAGGATDSGYGTYELSAAGVWVYTLDDNNAAVQALNGAATLTDTFTALTEDGTAQVVTVTINAQNDAASITGDATGDVTEAGGVANGTPGTMTDTGDLNDTDVDNAADSWQAVSAGGATDSGYGTYELSAAGVWVYTLDDNNAAVQALNGAATLTDTFTALTEDGTEQVVTITINAQNDAAVITGDASGDVTEAGGTNNGTPGTPTDTGDLNAADVDNTADAWQAVAPGGTTTNGYGTYELTAAGVWTFTLDDSNAAVQALNGAATLTDTFTALTEDGTEQVVTVTINAQNDAASITGDATGDVTEAGGVANGTPGTMTDTGDLNDTDVDNAADSWQAVSAGGATDSGYGTYELSAAGVWVYTLDDNNAAVQALNGAATLTDTFTALTEDGTEQVVTITINAQNDAAVITGDASGDVTEAGGTNNGTPGTPTDTGDLNAADVDNTADAWQAVAPGGTTTNGYGTYELTAAGVWTFTLDDSNAAVQALNGAATLTDTFTALTEDGTEQVVTITINAQNDAAVITGDASGDVTEAGGTNNGTPGTPTDTGDLNAADVDNTADAWQAVAPGGTTTNGYGTYELTAAGVWTFTLDDSNAAVQALNGAATLTDTFTALTEDGTEQVVTITINAQNDAAVITGDASGDVTEAGGTNNGTPGTPTDTGDLNAADVDNTADAWQAVAPGGTTTNGYGTYELTAAGVWTFTLDDSNAAVQALNGAATLTDTFTALTEDGTEQVVTITINAQNDAPVANDDTDSATEDGSVVLGTVANDSDVDDDVASLTYTLNAPVAGLTLDLDGGYSFDPSNAAYQYLKGGETFDVVATYTVTDPHSATDTATLTITVTGTNDEPAGADNTITFLEDMPYTLAAADFGFSDAVDGDSFAGVVITTLPLAGTLLLNGNPVTAGQFVSAADIGNGLLTFVNSLNANGDSYASFDFQVRDDGGTDHGGVNTDQSANTLTFNVTPVNDEPTLTATAANPTYLEDAPAADLFDGVTVSTVEPGQRITAMTLTVTNVTDGANEILRLDGTDIVLTNGNNVDTGINGLTVHVSLSGSTATVSFAAADMSEAEIATLIDTLGYRVAGQNPTDADRVVTITQLVDSGAGSAPDDNVAAPNLSSTVNVEPVNDAPTSTLLANDTRTYFEGGAAVTLDVGANGTIADVDSANFGGGSLSLNISSALAEDNLVIINTAIVTTSAGTVSVNGTAIGTFSGGSGGTPLVISFNTDATPAAVQLLVRALGYTNGGGDIPVGGLRTVNWSLNDGDGNANGGNPTLALITKVNVIPVNSGPDGADVTKPIDEDQTYHLQTTDFSFTDPENDAAGSLRFDSLPTHGTLYYDPDGAGPNAPFLVSPGLSVSWSTVSDVFYVPDPDYNGTDSFIFAIIDTGGAADATPNNYTFNIAAINDSPVVPNSPTITVTENIPDFVNPALAVSDVDLDARNGGAGDYGGATFLMNRSTGNDAQDEFIIMAGAGFTVTGGGDLQAGGLTFGHWVSNSGILQIDFDSAQTPATSALVDAVLQAIQYNNSSDTPPASVDLIYILDDGAPDAVQGALGSPFNNIDGGQVTVNITAVNDEPLIDFNGAAAGTNTSINYTENDPPTALVATASIIDPDSTDFDTGNLTVQFGGGTGTASDRLTIINQGTGAGQIGISGANVTYGGVTIGSFTGGTDGSTPLVVTFNANASQAAVTALMQEIAYSNVSDSPSTGDRQVTFDLADGDGGQSNQASSVVHVTAVEDPTQAADDSASTNENATVNIAVLANDSDLDGPPPAVAMVDGQAISVGSPVTLASGAIVSLNNDGTLTYDPNHQFDTLTSTASGETGAVNTSAPDSFTYTLTGGPTATVSITVNGVVSIQDHLEGDSGDNVITGTPNGDYFDLSQGGNDTASGLGANDGFFFGAAFTAADTVDGGAGNNDQIGLQGDYTGANALTLGANTIANIEAIVVLPGYSYDITTNNGNVAAGGVLKVQATPLGAGENLTFNGSAETDGSFLVYGGLGNDTMTGGAGNDGFYFGPGRFNSSDTVNGGGGSNDQLALDGNYGAFGPAFVLGGNVTNVEVVVLLPGPSGSPNTFNLTTADALVPAGQTMTIFGVQVATNIIFDGSNEHDGAFRIYGGSGNDIFTGGTGNDWIFGGYGGDQLTGGAGSDTFYYDDAAQSTSLGFDTIFGFDDSADTIDLPFAVTGLAAPASGNLSNATFDADLSTAFAGLTSHQAGMFTATGGDMNGRTFLVIDADGNAGYQAGSDYVIEIVTPVTPIDNSGMFI